MRRITVLCMIIFAPILATLSACADAGRGITPGDVLDNMLCRPTARIPCINAPDHGGGGQTY
jgi:hypothetical protein